MISTHQHRRPQRRQRKFLRPQWEIISTATREPIWSPATARAAAHGVHEETQLFLGGKEVRAVILAAATPTATPMMYFPACSRSTPAICSSPAAPLSFALLTAAASKTSNKDRSRRALDTYDFDTVIPGHGAVMKRADLVKWVVTIGELRARITKACAGGADGVGKRLDLSGFGWSGPGMLDRGMAGMCKELGS